MSFSLFQFASSLGFLLLRCNGPQITIDIRLDSVDLLGFLLELGSFVIEPLLLFGQSFLLCL